MTGAPRDEPSTADIARDRPTDEVRDRPTDDMDDERHQGPPPGPVPAQRPAEPPVDSRADSRVEPPVDSRVEPQPAAASARDTGPAPDAGVPGAGRAEAGPAGEPLLAPEHAHGFEARWTDIQHGFVDDPRRAVEEADTLVAELMQHLARTFADERAKLERQWSGGGEVATDDLREAFQRYRVFFARLLAT
jgi:hypothetical protein